MGFTIKMGNAIEVKDRILRWEEYEENDKKRKFLQKSLPANNITKVLIVHTNMYFHAISLVIANSAS